MATIKAFTDLSQSKVLAKILPIESADMYYDDIIDSVTGELFIPADGSTIKIGKGLGGSIAAWSLAALINILPIFIEYKGDKYYLRFMKEYVEYANDEVSITGRCLHTTGNNNLVDACYELILKLHELKML